MCVHTVPLHVMYIVDCTLHTAHFTLQNITLLTEDYTLHNAHYKLQTATCILNTVHCTLNTAHYTLHTAHCTLLNTKCSSSLARKALLPLLCAPPPTLGPVSLLLYSAVLLLLYSAVLLLLYSAQGSTVASVECSGLYCFFCRVL